ncbi:hypothetical protein GCM10027290_67800 [Micromonospora sonneratiae]
MAGGGQGGGPADETRVAGREVRHGPLIGTSHSSLAFVRCRGRLWNVGRSAVVVDDDLHATALYRLPCIAVSDDTLAYLRHGIPRSTVVGEPPTNLWDRRQLPLFVAGGWEPNVTVCVP